MNKTVLITGCAGFIGSHVTDEFLSAGYRVIGYDSFTYAAKESNLQNAYSFGDRFTIINGSINDNIFLTKVVREYKVDCIINLAAETHVDNSIVSSDVFVNTNILGTKNILDVCRKERCPLLHFSTDEVYGVSPLGVPFTETDSLNPRNPYSATKASADHLISSYANTYGIKFILVRPSNNFGTRQHGEKFIPTILRNISKGSKIPIYGQGNQIREWTNAKETAKAVRFIFENSPPNEIYNISSGVYLENIKVVETICSLLELDINKVIQYVQDRPGHDFRYSVSSEKLNKLGYSVSSNFYEEIKEVIQNDFSGLWNKT
jgi:dTDP-glucose 4,6-dehydratase